MCFQSHGKPLSYFHYITAVQHECSNSNFYQEIHLEVFLVSNSIGPSELQFFPGDMYGDSYCENQPCACHCLLSKAYKNAFPCYHCAALREVSGFNYAQENLLTFLHNLPFGNVDVSAPTREFDNYSKVAFILERLDQEGTYDLN